MSEAIQKLMAARFVAASGDLGVILSQGTEGARVALTQVNDKGGLDDNLLFLLDSNIEQARRVGADDYAKVLGSLADHLPFCVPGPCVMHLGWLVV